MMIHEKVMSGQFLLDLKNERSSLLQSAAITHQQPSLQNLQSPSPPIPALDIYSAYAYQQQLQQQLLNSHMPTANLVRPAAAEVLDLSRRDSVEISRKTPSPYHTNSSFGSASPAGSPNSLITQQTQQSQLLPSNLLYAAKVQNIRNLNIPGNLTALYPGLYYTDGAQPTDSLCITPPVTQPAIVNNNVLQTFTIGDRKLLKPDLGEHHSPHKVPQSATINTPSSSSSADAKNTRPFKAFPRDPIVIAANFAATDVLMDNPRVERYTEYRKRVLEQIRSSNGGSRTVTNPKMRRTNSVNGNIHEGSSSNTSENDDRHHEESSDCDSNSANDNRTSTNSKTSENSNNNVSGSGGIVKDAAYYERRRKNNAAAKKSRDRRRIKEDEIAIRAAYLERQNIELLCQIDALKAQLASLTSKMP